jgi:hypothetical protein
MHTGLNSGKGLTFWMATALVVGNMIGLCIVLLPSALDPYGGISVPGWLFTSVGAMVLALVFALLAFGYALWAIAGAVGAIVPQGTLLLLSGNPVHVLVKWRGGQSVTAPRVVGASGLRAAVGAPAPMETGV